VQIEQNARSTVAHVGTAAPGRPCRAKLGGVTPGSSYLGYGSHKNAAVLFVIPNRLSGESLPCFCRSPEPSEGEVEGNLLSRVFRSLFQPCRQSTSCLLPRASASLARASDSTSGLRPTSRISAPQER